MEKWRVQTGRLSFYCFLSFIGFGCGQMASDGEIKADIATKAKQETDFLGVKYSVKDRVVTLSGNCPTDKAKTNVEGKVKDIAGVKKVTDNIVIAPVTIGSDHALKQAVDNVLKNYPQAEADVKDSMVILQGAIKSKQHEKLLTALNKLQPRKIEDRLMVVQK